MPTSGSKIKQLYKHKEGGFRDGVNAVAAIYAEFNPFSNFRSV